jgi:cellulose synthase/poly-beta-1,6-N-acetylglucosamine synthase-like glycosyltransferase
VVVTLSDGKEFDWRSIPSRELVVVFDADMRAKPDFFLKTLEVMSDESLQLVLTPQVQAGTK